MIIDQATIDRIFDAANIVDVVSEFVTLRKRGVNYVGLCPFHSDKSPSFYVSPAKNICKCFACGEGGTAIHFIMKHEQLNYGDALRYLAKKYNIEIQEHELSNREKQKRSDRESMFIVNNWAQQYFTKQLYENREGKTIGLRYFAERGFREETIRKFQLGYSLDQPDALYKEGIDNGYKKEYLEKTGLIIVREDGRVSDRFRGRVIFPVHSLSGKVVAFGGRILKKDEKKAKYVNSPESEIYHKSNELYGIYLAKKAIMKEDRCFLVEGYTDVISMHQAGIENVVASSGTALTIGQIKLIHRFSSNITVLYDGDAAGIKAAVRGIDLLLEDGMNVKVVLLPDGEDPDSFARKHNATEFADFIKENETDFIRFKTRLLLNDAGNDPIKRTGLINDIIRTISIIPDNIARSIYIHECSMMMEIDEQVLIKEVKKIRDTNSKQEPPRGYQQRGMTTNAPMPVYPADMPAPPPPTEEELASAEVGPMNVPLPTDPFDEIAPKAGISVAQVARSPYEVYERSLLKYVIRYGEQILFDFTDEESGEHIKHYVAEYIRFDLERDDLTFYTPIYKQMLDEAADRCGTEGFVANRYFLAHPDQEISLLSANLISEKHQLSKYHSKYRELEKEDDRLDQLIVHELYAMKDAYILQQINTNQLKIKEAHAIGNMDKVMELMKELTRLNEIKSLLSKELGERIVLKM